MRLALCDLEAPGWKEPWLPYCAFVAPWLTDYCVALCGLLFSLLFYIAIPFFRPTPLGFRQVVQHVRLHVA